MMVKVADSWISFDEQFYLDQDTEVSLRSLCLCEQQLLCLHSSADRLQDTMGLQPLAAWDDAYSDAQQSAQEDGFVSEDADTPVTVQKDWISL